MALSLLLPGITVLLFAVVVRVIPMFFPVSDRIGDTILRSGLYMFAGTVVLNPALHGLVFRLRTKYDFENALRSVVIYLPIFVFATTVLIHAITALSDGETLLFTITWFEITIASYFGALMCVLPVLVHRVGLASEPAPTIVAHRLYQQTERAISLGSLFGVSILLLLAL
ncbi:MAG: hypothetical protein OXL97_08245 [Chloroflexota bacterium]|nr:hypothetical protein [Chloroflexota bacterium]MDE2885726.1 hypothetical protein [Chloroflexota bacterium]